jgi:small subunit ribosomal protein S16
MLHIRLTRIGKKKQPEYRLIVCEKARDPWGKALEILGHYNPRTNPVSVTLKQDRITHWISNGAQCSDTVWNLLVDQGVVKGEKRKSIKISKKRKEALAKKQKSADKAKEDAKAAAPVVEEKAPEAAPAEEAPKAEEKPAAEAPAEEPKAE